MTRILLVDDNKVVREGLRRMLEIEPDLKVVGEAADAKEALAQVESLSPEVTPEFPVERLYIAILPKTSLTESSLEVNWKSKPLRP